MSAARLVDNGKWLLWLAGVAATAIFGAIGFNRSAICKVEGDLRGEVKSNADQITALREWRAGADKDIGYIAAGVKRLEEKFDTLPKEPVKP